MFWNQPVTAPAERTGWFLDPHVVFHLSDFTHLEPSLDATYRHHEFRQRRRLQRSVLLDQSVTGHRADSGEGIKAEVKKVLKQPAYDDGSAGPVFVRYVD